MTKRYHGNFSRLVNNGKSFTNYLVQGRETVQVGDNLYHVIGMETLLTFSQKAKVYGFREFTIVRDGGRYHIFS